MKKIICALLLCLMTFGCGSDKEANETYEFASIERIRMYGPRHVVLDVRQQPGGPLVPHEYVLTKPPTIFDNVPPGFPMTARLFQRVVTKGHGCLPDAQYVYNTIELHVHSSGDLEYLRPVEREYD